MRKWIIAGLTVLIVAALVALAVTAGLWLPFVLSFSEANPETVQSLTGIIQALLALVGLVVAIVSLSIALKNNSITAEMLGLGRFGAGTDDSTGGDDLTPDNTPADRGGQVARQNNESNLQETTSVLGWWAG